MLIKPNKQFEFAVSAKLLVEYFVRSLVSLHYNVDTVLFITMLNACRTSFQTQFNFISALIVERHIDEAATVDF